MQPAPRSKLRVFLRWVWQVVKWAPPVIAALLVAVALSLQTLPVRHVVVAQVNDLLRTTFAGRVVIERVDHLGLTGLSGARVRIFDPSGSQVLLVDGASVGFATLSTVRSVLKKSGDMVIDITSVKLGYVDANLDVDKDGNLKLLDAFGPKEPAKSESPPSSRATVVHLRQITLAHGWVHGVPSDGTRVDADLDALDLSLIVGGDRTVADLSTLDIATRGLLPDGDVRAHLEAHYAKPAANGADQAARVDMRGDLSGATVATAFAGHASIDGTAAAANVHFASGPGTADIDARGTIADAKTLHVKLAAKNIDARAFARTAPATRVGADATFDLTLDAQGDGAASYWLDLPPGEAVGNLVPAAHFEGKATLAHARGGAAEITASGTGDVAEPGAHTAIRFQARKRDASTTVGVQINTVAPRLAQTRLGKDVGGSATLDADATITLGHATTVDASLDLRARNVARADARLERARLTAKARGPIDDPALDVTFDGRRMAARGMRFASAALGARGSLRAAEVTASLVPEDGPRVELRTAVSAEQGARVRDARVTIAREDVTAELAIGMAQIAGDDVRVDGVTLQGLGAPMQASFVKTNREITVRAASDGLDLGKVGRLLRLQDLRSGTAALDVDVTLRKGSATGHTRVDVRDATYRHVQNAKAHLDARFAGRTIDGEVRADLGTIGHLAVENAHFELDAKKPLTLIALEDTRGALELDVDLDVGRLKALLPRGAMPFTDMQGRLRLKGDMARKSSHEAPELHMSLATTGLVLSGKGDVEQVDGTRVYATPPWSIEGVDVEFGATVTEDRGATFVKGRLFDKEGTMISLDASSPALPYRQWLQAKAIDPQKLGDLRFAAQVDLPKRDLKKFPALLRTRQMAGAIAANVHFDGSIAAPDLRVTAEATQWAPAMPRGMEPMNAKVDASYRNGQGNAAIAVATSKRELFKGTVDLEDVPRGFPLAASETAAQWHASTRIHIADFPLETLDTFTDFRAGGIVSGDIDIDGLHQDARAKIALALRDLKVGKARFPRGNANVDFDGRSLRGALRLDQSDGYLQVEGGLGMRWGAESSPTLAAEEPAFATLKANRLRAAALLPFVRSAMSELDGRIDADARIDVTPGQGAPKMRGDIVLDAGRAQFARLGEPLHDLRARVKLTPDGIVRLEELRAQGSTGHFDIKGWARLHGFQLAAASFNVGIPKNDPFPIDIDGQQMGEIDTEMSIAASTTPDQRTMNVKVEIPRLHLQMPLGSSNKPQELGEAEKIHVGYFRRPRQFVVLPKDAEDLEESTVEPPQKSSMTTNIAVHLGNDVEVRRSTTLRMAVTGDPKVEIADKAKVSGQIRLTRGMLEIQGRRFQVEKGTVTFVGDDPGNPQIVVTAGWDAPDGTRVFAEFVGPLKTGKVRLRSEPSRPQNEILALIMFGTAEGSSSTPYPTQQPDGGTRAGAMAGGLATEGLSKGLDELTGLDVSTKIDTTNSANPKPELEVQIARDISLQIAYVLGTPSPGTNPDRTLFTLDWRFLRNWSMETTFGDQGSSILDLLWQYRY